MIMATQTLLFLISLLTLCSMKPIECDTRSNVPPRKALFVFGDSLFDPGNNQYLPDASLNRSATTFPYGETYYNHPTGRLSDGRIVPDLIAQFAKLSILGPYLQPGGHDFTNGTNFASAGAGVLEGTHPGTVSLRTQVNHFKDVKKGLKQKLGDAETQKLLNRAVYLFSIGGNDYFSYHKTNPTQREKRRLVANVVSNLTAVLREMYRLGGRKIAFQNVGPLGCLPNNIVVNSSKNSGPVCDEVHNSLARLHNMALSRSLKLMATKLPGFKHAIFDYYHSLEDRIMNPVKYGFKIGTVACYDTEKGVGGSKPGDYIWFDRAHTTEKANSQLAKLIWSGQPNVTGPYNMMHLFSLP